MAEIHHGSSEDGNTCYVPPSLTDIILEAMVKAGKSVREVTITWPTDLRYGGK